MCANERSNFRLIQHVLFLECSFRDLGCFCNPRSQRFLSGITSRRPRRHMEAWRRHSASILWIIAILSLHLVHTCTAVRVSKVIKQDPPVSMLNRHSLTSSSWQNSPRQSFLVVCTVDGGIHVINASTGIVQSTFSSGPSLVGASSAFEGREGAEKNRRIVPGLDGRLYVDDRATELLEPLAITVLDVLQSPVKTCSIENENRSLDCGIITATKSESLFAFNAENGRLLWHQKNDGQTTPNKKTGNERHSGRTLLLQRDDITVRQISAGSGEQVWNATLGTMQALNFGGEANSEETLDDMSILVKPGRDMGAYARLESNPASRHEQSEDVPINLHVQPLPIVVFGADGQSIKAIDYSDVDKQKNTKLHAAAWETEFGSVIASVFGLGGSGWMPVTVVDDIENIDLDEDDAIASYTIGNGLPNQASLPSAHDAGYGGLAPYKTFGEIDATLGLAFYHPPDWQAAIASQWQFSAWRDNARKLLSEPAYRLCYLYGNCEAYKLKMLSGQQAAKDVHPDIWNLHAHRLALPASPTWDAAGHAHHPHESRSGVFLTWNMIVFFCLLIGCLVFFVARILRKKMQISIANIRKQTILETLDINGPTTSDPADGSPPLATHGDKESPAKIARSQSMPAVRNPGEQTQANNPWLYRANTGDMMQNTITTNHAVVETDHAETDIDEPQSHLKSEAGTGKQEAGVIDGIPLVRYARYDSEFVETTALGRGGFGTVFRCQNVLDSREYAIKKVYIRHNPANEQQIAFSKRLKRVLREVKVLALLDHPNIVRYYTAWLELGQGVHIDKDTAQGSDANDYYLQYTSSSRPNSTTRQGMNNWNSIEESTSESSERYPLYMHNPQDFENCGFTFDRSTDDAALGGGNPVCADKAAHRVDGGFVLDNSEVELTKKDRSGLASKKHPNQASHLENLDGASSDCSESLLSNKEAGTTSFIPSKSENGLSKSTQQPNQKDKNEIIRHTLYIQMQLCSQKTLAEFLLDEEARKGPSKSSTIDVPFALRIFLQIIHGVEHVHQQGLIHRDLKPNNCFIDEFGIVKVGDFGLSRETGEQLASPLSEDLSQKTDGITEEITAGVGTRSYASPEQINGSDYDSSTDIYSLGIILFELCYPMYTGMERFIVLSKLRSLDFPDKWLVTVKKDFPSLHTLLTAMLSTRSSDRPPADSVASTIEAIVEQFTISSLDSGYHKDSILLRVEAKPHEDVLRHTIKLLKDATGPEYPMEILQYGLKGGTKKAVMEFALGFAHSTDPKVRLTLGEKIVSTLTLHEEIILIRQIFPSKPGST